MADEGTDVDVGRARSTPHRTAAADPARRQRRADVADLAAHEPQSTTVKAPTEVDAGVLVPIPGADDDPRLVPGDGDRLVQRLGICPKARRPSRRHAVRARVGSRPARHDVACRERAGRLRAIRRRLGGGQHRQRKARQQRDRQQARRCRGRSPARSLREGRAVEDEVDRRLHVGEQRGPLGSSPSGTGRSAATGARNIVAWGWKPKTRRPHQGRIDTLPTATTSPTHAYPYRNGTRRSPA